MGVDKATVDFEGHPLILRALHTLREAGLPVAISGGRPDLKDFADTIEDRGFSQGPLGGICGTLEVFPSPWSVFIPVDLPLLPADLIKLMLKTASNSRDAVVVPSVNGFAQTFPAVLNRGVLPLLTVELEEGRRGCFAAFQAAARVLGQQIRVVPVEILLQSGQLRHPAGLPAARWFFNINSTTDLERARSFRH